MWNTTYNNHEWYIVKPLDTGFHTDVISLDPSKAFDKVSIPNFVLGYSILE